MHAIKNDGASFDVTAEVDNKSSAESAAKAESDSVDTSTAHAYVNNDDVHDGTFDPSLREEQRQKRGHEAMSSTQRVDKQQMVIGIVNTEAPRGVWYGWAQGSLQPCCPKALVWSATRKKIDPE